ncbi:shikimate dehydrogenase [Deinococcus metallilatus]|uniref:Shikimate dehydrogenase n=2 Tax=Deinococcus TaxID=1298 RepID=A0AAJ5F5C1_9DEIO|nr:shikimate dehydrogenase [Deinococcus metallilatus]MBB5294203.1 shikimate dehydrogenase [Deinococcus metallilatus]QBY08982.1 shikimate dehydrogenase [Deinococcus metallilatus]RXJ10126.1 shikimate dehydrogenase [Deinococcus metallilatus]TLK27937.1 shikimate dehydrogenase [Deinococcus metallilatus]
MSAIPDAPLALIGYSSQAARAFREVGLVALTVPHDDLTAVLEACRTLRFAGALVHPTLEIAAAEVLDPDPDARRAGRVDAVAFTGGAASGGVHATYTLADALMDAVEESGYAARGASALFLGGAADLARALPLVRLGFEHVGIATDHLPDAERFARELPASVRAFALGRRDPALISLAERADLIVLASGSLPAGLLQPYHTLADLTGQGTTGTSGAARLDLAALPALRLARQLLHATGQRYRPEALAGLVGALV